MGISSALNLGSLTPGVCTSSSRPASPYEGQTIYETDTNQTLTYSGSAWVMVNDLDQPPGIQFIKGGTLTTETNVEITSVFSSEYRNYRLVFQLTALSAASAIVQLRLGTTAGTSYFAAASGVDQLGNSVSTIVNSGGQVNILDMANGFNIGGSFTIDILGPQVAIQTSVTGTFTSSDGQGFAAGFVSGTLNNTTSYTSFSLLASTGTFSGIYRVYGYRD